MIIRPKTIISGRYRIESLIATGGMGQVWMANDTVLDRRVAIKILKAEFSADSNFLTRFREEARTTARLNHPNIVSVYDYGEFRDVDGGYPIAYLVMELIHAESLSHALGRLGTLTVAQTLDMLSQTAQGLGAAHEEGIIHRDVKPGNILITPRGRVKISDFGIAKAVDSVPITRTGTVMGTAQYISPEQAVGKEATSASDIYSLGIVGYEALCGHRPFGGEGSVSAAMAHVTAKPDPLPSTIPANVRNLIGFALCKDPSARYRNGTEFARAISQVQAGNPAPLPESAASAAETAVMGGPFGGMGGAGGRGSVPPANATQILTSAMGTSGAVPGENNYQAVSNTPMPPQQPRPVYTEPVAEPAEPAKSHSSDESEESSHKDTAPRGLTAAQVVLIVLGVLLVIALITYAAYTLTGKSDLPTQSSERPTVTLTHTLTDSSDTSSETSESKKSEESPTVDSTEDDERDSGNSTDESSRNTTRTKTREPDNGGKSDSNVAPLTRTNDSGDLEIRSPRGRQLER